MTTVSVSQCESVSPHSNVPYGRQSIDDRDIEAVVETLRSAWLTTGPKVDEFESRVANFAGVSEGVALSSGTAALHAAMHALDIGPGDEVLVPTMTFAASANCVLYQGGTPVFVDVCEDTLLIDPQSVAARITPRTKAILAVDYAGQPCDYDALRRIANRHGVALVADACHSLGATYRGWPVGSLADLTVFSFHPVKPITTCEGGMVVTDRADLAERIRRFRNHGIATSHRERAERGTWQYEMLELGYNYRLSDLQCALGVSQLKKLPGWLEGRRLIARRYDQLLTKHDGIIPLSISPHMEHAFHLYVVRFEAENGRSGRDSAFDRLRRHGIGANVHYTPVHLHPYYQTRLGTRPGLCPIAEAAVENILSLPIFPDLAGEEVDRVVEILAFQSDTNRWVA